MYTNEPLPEGNFDEKNLLGGEACLWGESNDDTTLHNKAWPRTAAVGERLWSAKNITDVDAGKI